MVAVVILTNLVGFSGAGGGGIGVDGNAVAHNPKNYIIANFSHGGSGGINGGSGSISGINGGSGG